MFRGWFRRMVHEALQQPVDRQEPTPEMERMFSSSPCVVAFRINNGYVVRTTTGNEVIGHRQPGFTYCKDHQEIADYIVTTAVKDKLGFQHEMFEGPQGNTGPLGTLTRFTNGSI